MPSRSAPSDVQFLRLPEVIVRVGVSRTEICRRMQDGRFPRPLKLGVHRVAWPTTAIRQWQLDMELIG